VRRPRTRKRIRVEVDVTTAGQPDHARMRPRPGTALRLVDDRGRRA